MLIKQVPFLRHFLSCIYHGSSNLHDTLDTTDLEHSMGSGWGSIGVSWVLGPIPIPNLQHGEDLVGRLGGVSGETSNDQSLLSVLSEIQSSRGYQKVTYGLIVYLRKREGEGEGERERERERERGIIGKSMQKIITGIALVKLHTFSSFELSQEA